MNVGSIFNGFEDMGTFNYSFTWKFISLFISLLVYLLAEIVQFSLQCTLEKYWAVNFNRCSKWLPSAWMHILTRLTMQNVTLQRITESLTRLEASKTQEVFYLVCPLYVFIRTPYFSW